MLKRFIKDSSIYSISGAVSKGIAIFLIPFYTRVLSPKEYGIIDIITVLATVLNIVIGLEVYQAISRYYFDCKTDHSKQEYVSTTLFFLTFTFGISFLIMFLFAAPLSKLLLQDSSLKHIIRFAAITIYINGLYHFVLDVLRYRFEPKKHMVCSLTYSIVTISLSILFVLVLRKGVLGVYWAQAIGAAIGFLLAFTFNRSSYRFLFSFSILKAMLLFSLPLVPSSIAVYVLTYIDRISIRGLLGLSELGIYGVGFRLISFVPILMMAVNMALTPLIYSRYKEQDTPKQFAKLFRYFLFGALLAISSVSLFSKEILVIFTTPKYYAAASVMPFLIASGFLTNMYNFTPGLFIVKKTKIIAVINVVAALISFALNMLLIPRFNIFGAALANFTSASIAFSINMYFSQKNYFVPHNPTILLFSSFITIGVIFLGNSINIHSIFLGIFVKILLITLLIITLFFVRLIDFQLIKVTIAKHFNKLNPIT